jgi:hypothetical protein
MTINPTGYSHLESSDIYYLPKGNMSLALASKGAWWLSGGASASWPQGCGFESQVSSC